MQRVNVLITESYQHADLVREFLDANGITAKHVTKHAVQILPTQLDQVKELNASYRTWVEQVDRKALDECILNSNYIERVE